MADANEQKTYTFSELRDSGVLWAINRLVFHPRGMALGWGTYESPEGRYGGHPDEDYFVMHVADNEVFAFDGEDDDDGFRKFEAFLKSVREARLPPAE